MRALSLPGWRESVSGVDLSALRLRVLNNSYSTSFDSDQLLTCGQDRGVLDYTAGASTRVDSQLTFSTILPGTGYGLCLWFETTRVRRHRLCVYTRNTRKRLRSILPTNGLSLSPLEKTRTSYRCALICSATTMSGSGKPAYPHPPIVPRFIFGSPPSTARLTPSSRSAAMLWTSSRSSRKPRG